MPAPTEWIITVKDEDLDHIDDIVSDLEQAGLAVDRVLTILGQVTGRAEESCHQAFTQVSGVASVDISYRRTIAPPESDLQ